MTTHAPARRPTESPGGSFRVLLLENVHSSADELFEDRLVRVERRGAAIKDDELVAALEGVHLLGIRSKTHVTEAVLAGAKDLLAVGCFCIGTNQVDLVAANRVGIPVFNAPFSNTRSVAELIVGEMVVLARQLGDRSSEVHAGVWKKASGACYELRGKTLGIVGYGHIGQQLGVLAEAIGMRVVFHDIVPRLPMGNNRSLSSLGEVLATSHFVSLHVPATPETRNLIGPAELAAMHEGSYLLNASRGTVVVIPALAAALSSGHLAGAAIDVYPEEPERNSDGFRTELAGLRNVLLTPHIGGSTEEAQEAIGREVGYKLAKFATTGATTGAVNFPEVELPLQKEGHRILNVHRNVPGVLRDVNRIVSEMNANIDRQVLATDANIGYLIMDMRHDVSAEVSRAVGALDTSIRTRVLY